MSEQGLPAAADGQLVEFLLMLVGTGLPSLRAKL